MGLTYHSNPMWILVRDLRVTAAVSDSCVCRRAGVQLLRIKDKNISDQKISQTWWRWAAQITASKELVLHSPPRSGWCPGSLQVTSLWKLRPCESAPFQVQWPNHEVMVVAQWRWPPFYKRGMAQSPSVKANAQLSVLIMYSTWMLIPYCYSQLKFSCCFNLPDDPMIWDVFANPCKTLGVYTGICYAPPVNPRCTNTETVMRSAIFFPTRQIYAHKSFPTLCFGGFIAITGHLCHSHPVPSLGKTSQVLTFGHIRFSVALLPFSNLTAPKPNHVFPWSSLPSLISDSFETVAGRC